MRDIWEDIQRQNGVVVSAGALVEHAGAQSATGGGGGGGGRAALLPALTPAAGGSQPLAGRLHVDPRRTANPPSSSGQTSPTAPEQHGRRRGAHAAAGIFCRCP